MTMKYILLCLLFSSPLVQAQLTFQQAYHGGETADFGRAVQQTSDGGFIFTGITSIGAGPSDMYLLKTAPDGSIQWARSFGGPGNESGHFVQQTTDGGYIVIGNTDTRIGGGPWDMYLVKTTANGTLEWSTTYGDAGVEEGRAVQQTTDGGFVVTGRVTGPGGLHMCLLKVNATGAIQWAKIYGNTSSTAVGEAVKQTTDGGYIIAGSTSMHGNFDVFLVKTAADGSLQWTKTFGDSLSDMGYDVSQTNDGGYILTGTYGRSFTDSLSTSYYGDVYLIKTSAEGGLQWSKTFGYPLQHGIGHTVQQSQDGAYVIVAEKNEAYLLKTTSMGDLLWSKSYGKLIGASGKTAGHITSDGGFVLAGTVTNAATGFDVYLIKTDSAGESGCNEMNANTQVNTGGLAGTGGIATPLLLGTHPIATQSTVGGQAITLCSTASLDELPSKNAITLFPNPFVYQTTLESTEYLNNATVTLYNSTGQAVKRIEPVFGHTFTLFRENLAAGVYYLYLFENNRHIAREKLIVID